MRHTVCSCGWGRGFFLALVVVACAACGLAQDTANVLFSFNGAFGPGNLLLDSTGNLYGTVASGGTYSQGALFELERSQSGTWHEALLHTFTGGLDGGNPTSALVMDPAGNLYGTTGQGGDLTCQEYGNGVGCGIVFELTRTAAGGWKEVVLHTFLGGKRDGIQPLDGLTLDVAGNLYGTTAGGGGQGNGAVFKLARTSKGWKFSVIHSFAASEGLGGNRLIADAAGNLYGTTGNGGNFLNCSGGGCGLVFQLTPTWGGLWKMSILYTFTGGPDGAQPNTSLTFDTAGNLYGPGWKGGSSNDGVVFKLTPGSGGTWTESVLYSFTQGSGQAGSAPSALTFDGAGNLYGTIAIGGLYNYGAVFELTPSGGNWTESTLYSFTGGDDGSLPYGGAIFDSAGNLYTSASFDGSLDGGTILKLTPPATK